MTLLLLSVLFFCQVVRVSQVVALANPVLGLPPWKGGHTLLNPHCRSRCDDASTSLEDHSGDIEDPALISAASRPSIVVLDRPEPPIRSNVGAFTGELQESAMDIDHVIATTHNTLGTPLENGVDHIHMLRNVGIFWNELRGERIGSAIIRFSDRSRDRFQVEVTSDPRLFAQRYFNRFGRYLTYFRINVAVRRMDIHRGVLPNVPPVRPVDSAGNDLHGPGSAYASYIFNSEAMLASAQEQEFLANYLVHDILGAGNMHLFMLTWSIQYMHSATRPPYMTRLGRVARPQIPETPIHPHHLPGGAHPRLSAIVPVIQGSQVAVGVMAAPRLDIRTWIDSIEVRRPAGTNPSDPRGDLISASYPLAWGVLGTIAQVNIGFQERLVSRFYVDVTAAEDQLVQLYYRHHRRYLTYMRIHVGVNASPPSGLRPVPYVDRHVEPIEFTHEGLRAASWTLDIYERYGHLQQSRQRASYTVASTESTHGAHRIRLAYHIEYVDSLTPPPYAQHGMLADRPPERKFDRSNQLNRKQAHKDFPRKPPSHAP